MDFLGPDLAEDMTTSRYEINNGTNLREEICSCRTIDSNSSALSPRYLNGDGDPKVLSQCYPKPSLERDLCIESNLKHEAPRNIQRFSEDLPYPNFSLQITALRTTVFLDSGYSGCDETGARSGHPVHRCLRLRPAFIFYLPRLNLSKKCRFQDGEKRYKDAARVALSWR
jgi:hypothetical protein